MIGNFSDSLPVCIFFEISRVRWDQFDIKKTRHQAGFSFRRALLVH
jgi:hypothetical protein